MPPPLARAPLPGRADPLAPLLDLPGVPEALAGAMEAVDRLLAHRVLPSTDAQLARRTVSDVVAHAITSVHVPDRR